MTDVIDDKELIAFLDGTLSDAEADRIDALLAIDPALAARLAMLEPDTGGIAEAFEPLLADAPRAALQTGLAAIPPRRRFGKVPTRLAAIAAALLLVVAGAVAGATVDRALVAVSRPAQTALAEEAEWRQAVAGYVAMYTPATLAAVSGDPARSVAAVGSALHLPLTPVQLALSDLTLKAAQVLGYDGKALGQIAYLDPQSGPVALCIIQSGAPAADQAVERRQGLSIVYWSQGGRSFMVIGSAPVDRLKSWANQAARQIS